MHQAAVIIPTTGAPVLRQAVQSSLESRNAQVIVVVDGANHAQAAALALDGIRDPNLQLVTLAENIGGEGYYGHRIYGGFSFLVNAAHMFFLDQDNFIDPDHVEQLLALIAQGKLEWAYALRKAVDQNGQLVARDDCESLGDWSAIDGYHLIDTSCYCLTRNVAVRIASAWYGGWGQDRVVTELLLRHFPRHACSGRYTVNYRLREEWQHTFFPDGNARMAERYPEGFPWAAGAVQG